METAIHVGLIICLLAIITSIILERLGIVKNMGKYKYIIDFVSLIYAVIALIILVFFI